MFLINLAIGITLSAFTMMWILDIKRLKKRSALLKSSLLALFVGPLVGAAIAGIIIKSNDTTFTSLQLVQIVCCMGALAGLIVALLILIIAWIKKS
jgi:hypothetical protein